jgi:hypothetical protein
MGEIDSARAQREALEDVAARDAAGAEERYQALLKYLGVTLAKQRREQQPRTPDDK